MPTLPAGLRVTDLERSLTFYSAVGYAVLGTIEGTAFGSLSMLQLPGDPFATIELAHDPASPRPASALASITSSSRSSRWTRPPPTLPPRA